MLSTLLLIVHIVVCIGLILIVLLQTDKGEGLSGAFGGGASSTVFGERGSGGFLSKLTTTMAIVFMITSLVLSIFLPTWTTSTHGEGMQASTPIQTVPMPMPELPSGQ